jgi:hypothetical protein
MTTRKRRRSKVDPFIDQVGEVPDTKIAKLAGVTPENVRAYRKRRGIPARWRGEGQGASTLASSRPRKPKGGKRRKTKLEPYLDQLGVLPDTEIAELAGVTVGNVRAYRYRYGIPSARRAAKGEGAQAAAAAEPPPAPAPEPAAAPVEPEQPGVVAEPTPPTAGQAEPQASAAEGKEPTPQVKAFRIKVEGVGGTVAYVVIAENIAEAAGKALRTLEQRRVEGEVLSVEYLAVALKG